LTGGLESLLSRFRANSDVSQIAQLAPGEKLRLSEPVFACLEIAKKMELATRGAFSVTAAALKNQPAMPQWTLLKEQFSLRCDAGKLEFDLGASGSARRFCSSRAAAAFSLAMRRWKPPAGRAVWAMIIQRSDIA
jgi:hypothetical protein